MLDEINAYLRRERAEDEYQARVTREAKVWATRRSAFALTAAVCRDREPTEAMTELTEELAATITRLPDHWMPTQCAEDWDRARMLVRDIITLWQSGRLLVPQVRVNHHLATRVKGARTDPKSYV